MFHPVSFSPFIYTTLEHLKKWTRIFTLSVISFLEKMTSHRLYHNELLIIISYTTRGVILLPRNQIFSAYFIPDHSLKQNTLSYFGSIIYRTYET